MIPAKEIWNDLSASETIEDRFNDLVLRVQACTKCERMCNSTRVLNQSAGPLNAKIMFVGEAPGRLGADGSGIPFHGDTAGHNFESLIGQVGISRYNIFVTNAVLCNPKDEKGNNSTPNKREIANCKEHLKQQIEIINPAIVVTLGGSSLAALSLIEDHEIQLSEGVRKVFNWYGRKLIPLYHPGQRAMIHRSFHNQLSDYQFVAEQFRRLGRSKRTIQGETRLEILSIVERITDIKPKLSYFGLHKLFYLIEYAYFSKTGHKLSPAYFIRQKDGPYCTDLHITKLKRSISDLTTQEVAGTLYITKRPSLFNSTAPCLNKEAENVIQDIVARYGNKSDADLKRVAYLTQPMRRILRAEKQHQSNTFNTPIFLG